MKRLLPRPQGLRRQLILLLLGVLVIVQGVSIALFVEERDRAVIISTAKEAASRLLNVARELEDTPAAAHAAVLRAGESRDLSLSLSAAALTAAGDARPLDELTAKVARVVQATPQRALGIALGRPDPAAARPDREADWDGDPFELVLSVALADGRWLNARIDIGRPPLQWAWPAFVSVVLTAVGVVAVVWLTVRGIAGPMSALAGAADRLGQGETPEVLALKGPAEVQRVTDAFNEMAERITRLLAERSRMLAAIGHDLRSPITAMRVRLELVDDEESRQRLTACLDEIQSLVEAALALARGASTAEPRAPVHLPDLLQSVVAELRERGGKAALSVQDDVTVAARPAALKRALRNIVENAVRYGEEATIVLSGGAAEVRIDVSDKGQGIPAQDRERVFEPFVRLESSRSRDTGGAGLGLAIARAVIESHGGKVVLEAGASGGTRAVVTLPAA